VSFFLEILRLISPIGGDDIERKTVLAALVLAMFVLVIDTTIMNVSISTLIEDFDTDVATVRLPLHSILL
jgi:hypothetical protein